MNKLRPIGTEFWIEYPPAHDSTDCKGRRIKYRVVAHTKSARFVGDEKGILAEEIKPIEIEEEEKK